MKCVGFCPSDARFLRELDLSQGSQASAMVVIIQYFQIERSKVRTNRLVAIVECNSCVESCPVRITDEKYTFEVASYK